MNKSTALYALGMMKSSAQLAVYEEDKVKKQRFLDRVDYHSETVKKYLEESNGACKEVPDMRNRNDV